MANDCLNLKLYNARIKFIKPQGVNKALCELVPMIAKLVASKAIRGGDEVRLECASSVFRVVLLLANPPHRHCTHRDAHPYSLD